MLFSYMMFLSEVGIVGHRGCWTRSSAGAGCRVRDARRKHHFHVWGLPDFLQFLLAVRFPCEITHTQVYAKEFAVVLTVAGP